MVCRILRHLGIGCNEAVLPYPYPCKNHRMHPDLCVIAYHGRGGLRGGRKTVVGQHREGIDEHELTKHTAFRQVNIAMQTAISAHGHMALKVAERADYAMLRNMTVLADDSMMPRLEMLSEGAARVDNRVASNDGLRTDDSGGLGVIFFREKF